MQQALQEAFLALEEDEVPIGAVIVCKDKIIARGHNMTERLKDSTSHAEMIAISAAQEYLASKYLTGCKIYVTLEPCLMCAGAIMLSHLDALIYGAKDPKRGYSNFCSPFNKKMQIQSGILMDDCSKIITNFFQTKRY